MDHLVCKCALLCAVISFHLLSSWLIIIRFIVPVQEVHYTTQSDHNNTTAKNDHHRKDTVNLGRNTFCILFALRIKRRRRRSKANLRDSSTCGFCVFCAKCSPKSSVLRTKYSQCKFIFHSAPTTSLLSGRDIAPAIFSRKYVDAYPS